MIVLAQRDSSCAATCRLEQNKKSSELVSHSLFLCPAWPVGDDWISFQQVVAPDLIDHPSNIMSLWDLGTSRLSSLHVQILSSNDTARGPSCSCHSHSEQLYDGGQTNQSVGLCREDLGSNHTVDCMFQSLSSLSTSFGFGHQKAVKTNHQLVPMGLDWLDVFVM